MKYTKSSHAALISLPVIPEPVYLNTPGVPEAGVPVDDVQQFLLGHIGFSVFLHQMEFHILSQGDPGSRPG